MYSPQPAFNPPASRMSPRPNRFLSGFAQWRGTRKEQNDVVYISEPDPDRGILIAMADGIGLDEEAGNAANAAVNAMKADFLRKEPVAELHRQTLRMIGAAHAAVRELSGGKFSPGASAACVLVRNGYLSFGSAGNVRVFLCRAGLLLQLSRDHLLSLEAEEKALLSDGSARSDPEWAKTVTAFAGQDGIRKIDCQEPPVRIIPGDRILVMSSGLYSALPEETLVSVILGGPPQPAAEEIIRRVKDLGSASRSNISAALIHALA